MFLEYLSGAVPAELLLAHPAYAAVRKHSRQTSGVDLGPEQLDAALEGLDSPFFGLRGVRANLQAIREFATAGQQAGPRWAAEVTAELSRFVDSDALDGVVAYPVIGYDAGIGMDEAACLNVNWPVYLERPQEFPYMIAHEVCHVIYKRTRPFPEIAQGLTSGNLSLAGWRELFWRMTQDEGFAVYAPLSLRQRRGHLGNASSPVLYDYVVLYDEPLLQQHLAWWLQVDEMLADGSPRSPDELAEMVFGQRRLTYRVGCEMVRRIEAAEGLAGVRAAFEMAPASFVAKYRP
jgi:hypothetical protein